MIIMMIVIPGSNRHLERKYQVLAILIFGVQGIWNLNFKYPALGTGNFNFENASHLEFPFQVPCTCNLNF